MMGDYVKKRIITCDIDGVLTDYPACWLKFLQDECGTLYSSTDEAKENEPKYSYYKDLYRESDYKATLPIIEHNKLALNKLSEKFDIVFATSRPINDEKYPSLKANTYNWLKNTGIEFKDLVFKDENAKYLENLDVVFHIDDELKYANAAAIQIKNNKTNNYGECGAYLINSFDSLDPNLLNNGVMVVKSVQEIHEFPFFSVCIPATNRGDTIYRALQSVAKQYYRNFELILVDCESNDNTVSEIERFFLSEDFKNHPFNYTFEKKNYVPVGTEDWNDPIKLAKGKYIAMLEGDDAWCPNHLSNAYSSLSKYSNIGLYGSSNLSSKRNFQGLLNNEKAKDFCYIMQFGPVPPSESIFIRCNNTNEKEFLYNSDDYKYSPEIALYVDIVLNGYDVFYSQEQDVYREPSSNPDKLQTWYYFVDRFVLINKYKSFYSDNIVFKSKVYNGTVVCKSAIYTKSFKKSSGLIRNLKNEIGIVITIFCFLSAICSILINVVLKLLRIRKN